MLLRLKYAQRKWPRHFLPGSRSIDLWYIFSPRKQPSKSIVFLRTLEALIIVGRRVPQNMASYVSFVRCFFMELVHFYGISDIFMGLATFLRD